MSIVVRDTVRGALKVSELLDRECFSSWQEFIARLPTLLSVEVPANIGGVIASQGEPSEDDRGKLWLRLDTSGKYVGIYTFQNGKWEKFFQYAEGEIIWITGDSNNIPRGFRLIAPGDGSLPSSVVSALTAQYVPNPSGGYYYFAVRYVGF